MIVSIFSRYVQFHSDLHSPISLSDHNIPNVSQNPLEHQASTRDLTSVAESHHSPNSETPRRWLPRSVREDGARRRSRGLHQAVYSSRHQSGQHLATRPYHLLQCSNPQLSRLPEDHRPRTALDANFSGHVCQPQSPILRDLQREI